MTKSEGSMNYSDDESTRDRSEWKYAPKPSIGGASDICLRDKTMDHIYNMNPRREGRSSRFSPVSLPPTVHRYIHASKISWPAMYI